MGPEGQNQRARLERSISTLELRKALKTKVGVPVNELELTFEGQVLLEGVAQPFLFKSADEMEMVVHWKRVDRLESLMTQRNILTINHQGKFDRTLLHFAVLDGEIDLIRRVIEHKDRDPKRDLINVKDVFHDTPVMLASILGYVEIVELLVDRQADLGVQNLCGRTALQMAAEHGHRKCVKTLLQEKCSLGHGPPRKGPLGATNISRGAEYLAELNERHAAQLRIKVYKMSQRKQPGMDF